MRNMRIFNLSKVSVIIGKLPNLNLGLEKSAELKAKKITLWSLKT